MPEIAKVIDTLPGWVIPASVGGVVLVALFSQKKSSAGTIGNVTAYAPVPADPGLVALASKQVDARQSVYNTALSALVSRDISGISANRDIAISGINASVANERTRASEAIGIAQTQAATKISLAQAQTASEINRTNVAGATSQAHIAAKTQLGNQIVNGIGSVVRAVGHFFGF